MAIKKSSRTNKKDKEDNLGMTKTKVCPRCNSIKISQDKSNPLVGAVGAPPKFYCENCDYTSFVFPEVNLEKAKKMKTKIIKKDDKTKKVDTSYGDYLRKFWWKIIGPIALIVGLIIIYSNSDYTTGGILIIISLIMIYFGFLKK